MWRCLLTCVVLSRRQSRRQIIRTPQLCRCSRVSVSRDIQVIGISENHIDEFLLPMRRLHVLPARYVDQCWRLGVELLCWFKVSRLPSQMVVICVFSLSMYFGSILRFLWQSVYRIDLCLFSVNSLHVFAHASVHRSTVWLSVLTSCAGHSCQSHCVYVLTDASC